jgi:hypothetical protein
VDQYRANSDNFDASLLRRLNEAYELADRLLTAAARIDRASAQARDEQQRREREREREQLCLLRGP